jgi:hypothetical protein
MNSIMECIEPRHGSPFTSNKDLILDNKFLNTAYRQILNFGFKILFNFIAWAKGDLFDINEMFSIPC